MRGRLLIVDNYDSFVFNLYQALGEITGEEAVVVRHDELDVPTLCSCPPRAVILSPGPGSPEVPRWFGQGLQLVRALGPYVPMLGVCLGHQGIAVALGGRIRRAPRPIHGMTSTIEHDGSWLYRGLPRRIEVMRYHSLVVDPAHLPSVLKVTSETADGLIMSLEHRVWSVAGVQFHPESVGTPHGQAILKNFLLGRDR